MLGAPIGAVGAYLKGARASRKALKEGATQLKLSKARLPWHTSRRPRKPWLSKAPYFSSEPQACNARWDADVEGLHQGPMVDIDAAEGDSSPGERSPCARQL